MQDNRIETTKVKYAIVQLSEDDQDGYEIEPGCVSGAINKLPVIRLGDSFDGVNLPQGTWQVKGLIKDILEKEGELSKELFGNPSFSFSDPVHKQAFLALMYNCYHDKNANPLVLENIG